MIPQVDVTDQHDTAVRSHILTQVYPCPQCGAIDTPTLGPGAGPHCAAALCRHCGRFLQWLSQYPPAERQARRQQALKQAMAHRPPSALQLAFLRSLGDAGPPPASMAEASERIDARMRGEVRA